jgi:hypothetical protein
VVSFKELLRSVAPGDDIDLLDSLLAEGRAADNVLEGLRRSAIMKMGCAISPCSISIRTRYSVFRSIRGSSF